MPPAGPRMPRECDEPDPGSKRGPKAERNAQQPEPPEDRKTARHDHCKRHREPPRHRPPPEIERIRATPPENEEAEDEADVGGIEDMAAAPANEVLREQGHRRRAHEDPPAAEAPPVAVLRARHAKHEGDA